MKKQHPIMWFEGMPVGPTIFQQHNLYLENLHRLYHEMAYAFSWGILEAKFDSTSLSEGHFKLSSLKAINQNNILFDIDETDNLKINLKEFKDLFKDDKDVFVFLCLPKNDYTSQQNENNPKYSIEYQEVFDLNDKTEKIGMSFLKPNYSLEVGDAASLKNESIAIAKIKFNGMSFSLDNYTYPTQKILNADFLSKEIKNLILKMKDKIKYLKNIKKKSLEQYSQLSNISNILFELEVAFKSNDHPYNIYKILAKGVGACFNFSSKKDFPNLDLYNHQNITDSIAPLILYIDSNVNSIFEAFKLNRFIKTKNQFELLIENTPSEYFLIAVEKSGAMSYNDLTQWISKIVITTDDKLEQAKEQRSRGAEREKVENYDDVEIQEIPDTLVFKVFVKKAFISENATLCLFNNDEEISNPSSVYLIEA